jgi:hypothetical protein
VSAQGRPASSLTFDLRGLVWGIESEVAVITNLCQRIDEHVEAVNALRSEQARRLTALDELVAVADHPQLRAWLEAVAAPPLPQQVELFPDRLYAD